jgi:tripartite-type tricarboxylate transporter receptor subunit TctC
MQSPSLDSAILDRIRRRDLITMASGIALGSVVGSGALAQGGPGIRIVVAFPAGGVADTLARLVGNSLAKTLNRTVVVENRPGAAGLIGTKMALQPGPDANATTLLLTYIGLYGLPFTLKGADYDPHKDFVPVAMIGDGPGFLFVHESVPAKTVPEFIAWAKTQPAGVEAATSGPGGGSFMWTTWMSKMAGINLLPVPYKGGAEMTKAIITGEAKFFLSNTSEALNAQVKAGKVRMLAVASRSPTLLAPGVPTVAETLPGYVVDSWWGLHAPASTPAKEVQSISAAVKVAIDDPALRERFLGMYIEPKYANSADFEVAGRKTTEFWKKISADLGVKPE